VYMLDGVAELPARRDLALEWFEQLKAPRKQRFTFENAGHSVVFEQFEVFSKIMQETILPDTYSNSIRSMKWVVKRERVASIVSQLS
jgi:proline iminopeptidase